MDDFFEEKSSEGSIFPFLSVLCCVIGTMVLILVAGSLNAAGIITPEVKERIEKAAESLSELSSEADELSKLTTDANALRKNLGRLPELEALEAKLLEIKSDISKAMARAEKIWKETGLIVEAPEKKKVLVQQTGVRADLDSAKKVRDAAKARVGGLTAEQDGLAGDLQRTENTIAATKTRVLVDGAEVPLALFDLGVDSMRVLSDGLSAEKGTQFTRAEAMGEGGALDRLAAEIARPGRKLHPVLLVRPGAVELHDEAARRFRKWRVDFSHEPVEADWKLALE